MVTPYEEFQLGKHGNILIEWTPTIPVSDETENGHDDSIDSDRQFIQEQELWHNEQEF